MRRVRVPDPVRPGGHIRIVSPTAPSVAYLPDRARRAETALTGAGFTVSYGQHAVAASIDGVTAGRPDQRAADVMAAFADPSVDAILSADAGSRTSELLDFLDPEVIAAHPKPFVGFCDNVRLNYFLANTVGLSSLYGCVFIPHLGEAGGVFPETLAGLVRALDSATPLRCAPVGRRNGERINWYLPEADSRPRHRCVPGGWTWLRTGRAEGPLLGAEISMLIDLVRHHGFTAESTVLFWHQAFKGQDQSETAFRSLCESVDLRGLAAMVVGAHPSAPPAEWAARVSDLLEESLPDIDYPVLVNADISHLSPVWTVPYGEAVVVDSATGLYFPRHD